LKTATVAASHVLSGLIPSVMAAFPACMANLDRREYLAVTGVMVVTEPKVIREAQERLGPRGHLVPWVLLV